MSDTHKAVVAKSFSLRTQGPSPIEEGGNYGFVMQTFGVERNITHSYCAISDTLKGTKNMQAFMPINIGNFPNPSDPNDNYSVSSSGPFKSVQYSGKNSFMENGGRLDLIFTGSESFSSTFCGVEDQALSGDESSCEDKVI